MLVLSRKKNETVEVGGGFSFGGIDVVVIEIRGDKVRLGFNAPKEIPVHRGEVANAIRRNQREDQQEADQAAPAA